MDWRESVNCQNCVTLNKKLELFDLLKQKCCKNDDITKNFIILKTSYEKSVKVFENKSRKLTEARVKLKELEKAEEFLKRKNAENQLRLVSLDTKYQELLKDAENEQNKYAFLLQEKLNLEEVVQTKENEMASLILISKQSEERLGNEIEDLKSKVEKFRESSKSSKKELHAYVTRNASRVKKHEKLANKICGIFKDGVILSGEPLKKLKRIVAGLQAKQNAAKLEAELNSPSMTPDGTNSSDTGVFSGDEDFGCPSLTNDLEVSSGSSDDEFEDVHPFLTSEVAASSALKRLNPFKSSKLRVSPLKGCASPEAPFSKSKQDNDSNNPMDLDDDADVTLQPSFNGSISGDVQMEARSPIPSPARLPTSTSLHNTFYSKTVNALPPESETQSSEPTAKSESRSNNLDTILEGNSSRGLTSPVSSPCKEMGFSLFLNLSPSRTEVAASGLASELTGNVAALKAADNLKCMESNSDIEVSNGPWSTEHPQKCQSVSLEPKGSTDSGQPDESAAIPAGNQCRSLTSPIDFPDISAPSSSKCQGQNLTSPTSSPSKVLATHSSLEKSPAAGSNHLNPNEDLFDLTFGVSTPSVEPDASRSEEQSEMHKEAASPKSGFVDSENRSDNCDSETPERTRTLPDILNLEERNDNNVLDIIGKEICSKSDARSSDTPHAEVGLQSIIQEEKCSNISPVEICQNNIASVTDSNSSDSPPTDISMVDPDAACESIDFISKLVGDTQDLDPTDVELQFMLNEWSPPSPVMPFSEDSSSFDGKMTDRHISQTPNLFSTQTSVLSMALPQISVDPVLLKKPESEDSIRRFNVAILKNSVGTLTKKPQNVSTATSPIPHLSWRNSQDKHYEDAFTSPRKTDSCDKASSPVKISYRNVGVTPVRELQKNVAVSPMKISKRSCATSPVKCLFRDSVTSPRKVKQSDIGTSPMKTDVRNSLATSTNADKSIQSYFVLQNPLTLDEDSNSVSWSQELKMLQQTLEVLGINSRDLSGVVLDKTLVEELRQAIQMALKKVTQPETLTPKKSSPIQETERKSFCRFDPCEFAELCNQQHYNLHLLARSKCLEKNMCSFKKKSKLKRLNSNINKKRRAAFSFSEDLLEEKGRRPKIKKVRCQALEEESNENSPFEKAVINSSVSRIEMVQKCSRAVPLVENNGSRSALESVGNNCVQNSTLSPSNIPEVNSEPDNDILSNNEAISICVDSSAENIVENGLDVNPSDNECTTVHGSLAKSKPVSNLSPVLPAETPMNISDTSKTDEDIVGINDNCNESDPLILMPKPAPVLSRKRHSASSESSIADCSDTVSNNVAIRRSPRLKKTRVAHHCTSSSIPSLKQGYLKFVRSETIVSSDCGQPSGISSQSEDLPVSRPNDSMKSPRLESAVSESHTVESSSEEELLPWSPIKKVKRKAKVSRTQVKENVTSLKRSAPNTSMNETSSKRTKLELCNGNSKTTDANGPTSTVVQESEDERITGEGCEKNQGITKDKIVNTKAPSVGRRQACAARKPSKLQKLRSSVSKLHPLVLGSKPSRGFEEEEESLIHCSKTPPRLEPTSLKPQPRSESSSLEPQPQSESTSFEISVSSPLQTKEAAILEKFKGRESVRMAAPASGRTAMLIQSNQIGEVKRNAVGVHRLPVTVITRPVRTPTRNQPFVRPEDRKSAVERHVPLKPVVRPEDRLSVLRRSLSSGTENDNCTADNDVSLSREDVLGSTIVPKSGQTLEKHAIETKPEQFQKKDRCSSFLISDTDRRISTASPVSCALTDQQQSQTSPCDMNELKQTENLVKNTLKEFIAATSFTPGVLQKAIDTLSPPDLYKILPVIVRDIVKMMDDDFDSTPLRLGKQQQFVPPLTPVQQQLITLIVQLSCQQQHLKQLPHQVLRLLEYRMFRLGRAPEGDRLTWCSRFHAAICRVLCLRSQALIFCWDSLYALRGKSFTVVKAVMDVWPQLFPINPSFQNVCPNAQVLLHLLRSHVETQPGAQPNRFDNSSLRRLLNCTGLQSLSINSSILASNIYSNLIDGADDTNVPAFLLLTKRGQEQWVVRDIVSGMLLPALDRWRSKSLNDVAAERVIWTLCSILRALPPERNGGICFTLMKLLISEVLQQENGQVSPQMQEVIAIGLSLLSRHDIETVARALLSWHPNHGTSTGYSSCLIQYLTAMINSGVRPVSWWQDLTTKSSRVLPQV